MPLTDIPAEVFAKVMPNLMMYVLQILYAYHHRNKEAESGYMLGKPQDRIAIETTIRTMTSAAFNILRALMHAAYVWCCYHHEASVTFTSKMY